MRCDARMTDTFNDYDLHGAAAARTAWEAVQQHRVQAAGMRRTAMQHLRLFAITQEHRDAVRAGILEMTAGDRTGARRAALLKRISPAAQSATLASLVGTYERAVAMERQAHGLARHALPPELAAEDAARQRPPTRQLTPQELEASFDRLRAKLARHAALHAGEAGSSPPPQAPGA